MYMVLMHLNGKCFAHHQAHDQLIVLPLDLCTLAAHKKSVYCYIASR